MIEIWLRDSVAGLTMDRFASRRPVQEMPALGSPGAGFFAFQGGLLDSVVVAVFALKALLFSGAASGAN